MGWALFAAFAVFCVILFGALWRISVAFLFVALAVLTVLAIGGGYCLARDLAGSGRYWSIGFVVFLYGFLLYLLGQKYCMNERYFELTTPADFKAFLAKQPEVKTYQRFLAALPKVLFVYIIVLAIGGAIANSTHGVR